MDNPDWIISEKLNFSFTTKDLLTVNLKKYFGSNKIDFYPESVLYNCESDLIKIEESYYQSLLEAFSRLIIQNESTEQISWIKGILFLIENRSKGFVKGFNILKLIKK